MDNLKLQNSLILRLKKQEDLRYGENPHQKSAFYLRGGDRQGFELLWGIELSHNNLGDANHAWSLVCEFSEPTVAIIKHTNPCGISSRAKVEDAYRLAYEADKVSAFGGIIATNVEPTIEMVDAMHGVFYELLVAPNFPPDVLERLKKRSNRMRVIKADRSPKQLEFTRVFNGYLIQTPDDVNEPMSKWKVVAGRMPGEKTMQDLEFAWKVCKHVKSNAIVVVRDKNLIGMGTGQPNRVNSVKLAINQGKKKVKGAILASDAFFPFADNVELAARHGIGVIIQPGGSINDNEVIATAKKHKMTMIFTGIRHFKH